MDIFAQSCLSKLRFPELGKGTISTEDLWSIAEETLAAVATGLDEQIAKAGTNKYLRVKSSADTMLILKRDILAYVIAWKLDQKDASRTAALESQEERELRELINEKEKEVKKGKSLEELKAEYNAKYTGK